MFGGQEDDNKKLNDMWCFDIASSKWSQVTDSDYKPTPRSGHSTVVHGSKMYIFGGILELTKELNDLVVFDFTTKQFSSRSDLDEDMGAKQAQEESPTMRTNKQETFKRSKTIGVNSLMRSPTKTPSQINK